MYTIEQLENLLREREPSLDDFTRNGATDECDYCEAVGRYRQRQHYSPLLIEALRKNMELQAKLDAIATIHKNANTTYSPEALTDAVSDIGDILERDVNNE